MPILSFSERKIVKSQLTAMESMMARLPKDHLAQPGGVARWCKLLDEMAELMERLERRPIPVA